MKLLFVTPWPLQSHGGGQRLVRELAEALATHHGFVVHVAAGSGLPGTPPAPIVMTGASREVRLPLIQRAGTNWWGGRASVATTTFLEGLEQLADLTRPDVVLYAPHYSSCARQAAAVALRLRKPFALVPAIHMDHRQHVDRDARQLYRSADLVVGLSEAECRWLQRSARVPEQRALLLECGWGGTALTPDRSRPSRRVLRLLTVGAYLRHKQVDHQLKAVARLRDRFGLRAHLTVAGALASPAVRDRLSAQARQLNLAHDVEFRADCTDAQLARLHAEADCFLFTSRSESFGLAVLDAIGFGLLPVVYPHPIYRQLVDSSGFGVVAARSTPTALADALRVSVDSAARSDDRRRVNWLRLRSWPQASAQLAETLRRLPAYHSREGSR